MSSHLLALARAVRAKLPPLVITVSHGQLLSRWYGVAWVDMHRPCAATMPIPLNVLVFYAREVVFWFKRGGRAISDSPGVAYEQGRRDERASWLALSEDPLG